MTCNKHHYGAPESFRSISQKSPKTHDTITTLIHCVKCLKQFKIFTEILRERPSALLEEANLIQELQSIKKPLANLEQIFNNLLCLGYTNEELKSFLDAYSTQGFDRTVFHGCLKTEHKLLIEDILTGVLV